MIDRGVCDLKKPECMLCSLIARLRIINFNIRTFGKIVKNYFKNSVINSVIFWNMDPE